MTPEEQRAALLVLAIVVGLALVLAGVYMAAVAPILGSSVLGLMYMVYLFLTTEHWGWHNAQEYENRFWSLCAFMLTAAFMFAPDSPVALRLVGFFGEQAQNVGVGISLVVMLFTHKYDRDAHRHSLCNARRTSSID